MQPQKNPGFLTKVKRDKYLLLLLLPCALYYIIFKYVPIFGISIAFMDYNLFKGITESDWVGFKYFSMFFNTPDFWPVLRNTFLLGLQADLRLSGTYHPCFTH